MTREIIYYTNNNLPEEIFTTVQKRLLSMNLPIVSCSLKPIDFGRNIVLPLSPGPVAMTKQIYAALEASKADIVYFCEHDILYNPSHFEFKPLLPNIFYYNTNSWRWKYPEDIVITYNRLTSLSNLCVYRKLALDHYKKRLELIEKNEWEKQTGREPYWIRRLGYEPGTKSKRQELIANDGCSYWKSKYPNIDIRHSGTLTKRKCALKEFKHPPNNWTQTTLDKVPGWNLKKLFNLP